MSDAETPPSSGPTPRSIAAQGEWGSLVDQSLPAVRASAGKWRDGLAALITLVTAGLVVSGPDKASDMTGPWRWAVAAGIVGGMLAVLVGLLNALVVAAGKPRRLTFEQFLASGGSARSIEADEAIDGARRLRNARRWAVPGIVAVLLAIGAWIVSPTSTPKPGLQVTTSTEVVCGALTSADHSTLVLQLKGESLPVSIRFTDVVNASVVTTCEDARIRS